MTSIAELVVSAKPQGVDEVESEMNNLENTTQETTENLDQSAGMLSGLARKFKGGMMAIVGGLAIAAGGVLSQVPVLGQAMDGLKAIFQALAFQVDKKLRPFISKLSQEFFELSDAIFAGNYGQAKKEIGDSISLFSSIDVTRLIKDFQDLAANAVGFLADSFRQANENITAGDIQAITAKVIRLIKRGFRKLINATDWSALIGDIIEFMGKFQEGASKAVNNEIVKPLTGYIEDNWKDWVKGAIQFGKDLVKNIAKGIKNNNVDLRNAVESMEIASGITLGDVGALSAMAGGPVGMAAREAYNSDFIGSRGSGNSTIMIDGSRLNDTQGRYRKDALNRRG